MSERLYAAESQDLAKLGQILDNDDIHSSNSRGTDGLLLLFGVVGEDLFFLCEVPGGDFCSCLRLLVVAVFLV